MQHIVADDESARPALSIVIDGVAMRYQMLEDGASDNAFASGSAKPLVNSTDNYICKYTIPADTVGTIALQVGVATTDLAGNTVVEVSEYVASFVVRSLTMEEACRAHYEQYGFSEETIERLVQYYIEAQQISDAYDSGEIPAQEATARSGVNYEKAFGISDWDARLLRDVYMEERPKGEKLASREIIGIAYLLVKEAHPDAEGEEFEELFREVAREVAIVVYIC